MFGVDDPLFKLSAFFISTGTGGASNQDNQAGGAGGAINITAGSGGPNSAAANDSGAGGGG